MSPTKPECGDMPCARALEQPRRIGRARWVCPDCGRDVSMVLLLIAEAEMEMETTRDRASASVAITGFSHG